MSRCLLGDRVRYDGNIKEYPQLIAFIRQYFDVIAVCPEVEIGLGVPRPPIQLGGSIKKIKMYGRDDASIDVTTQMQKYCQQRPAQLNSIHGYIFKSKSPSCGIKNIPVFNNNNEVSGLTAGVFVNAILQHYPKLPITDELGLTEHNQYKSFLHQVKRYQQEKLC